MSVGLPPEKLRQVIVRAFLEEGLTYGQIAHLLDIGEATVSRVLRLPRETGGETPRPRRGGNFSPSRGKVEGAFKHLVVQTQDATVLELLEVLTARTGIGISRASMQRALHLLGFSHKKVLRRLRARRAAKPLAPACPRGATECGGRPAPHLPRRILLQHLHGTRVRGAPVGQRARGLRPGGHWTALPLVGAIRVRCRPKLSDAPMSHQWACLRALCPAAPLSLASLGRHCADGQPRGAQGQRRASGYRSCGGLHGVPATYTPDFNPTSCGGRT